MRGRDLFRQLLAENKNVAAFLRVIRSGESSQDDEAYRWLFGSTAKNPKLCDLSFFEPSGFDSSHPNVRTYETYDGQFIKNGKIDFTTAAGAYQITNTTWKSLSSYQFESFSPVCQDHAALALIERRGALDDVIAGRLHEAIRKCRNEWASLPNSPYGQPTKTSAQAQKVYEQYGGTLATETKKEKVMAPIIPIILQALVPLIPKLGSLFGSGSEVANRNVAAGTVIADALVEVTGAMNIQEAAERIQSDPVTLEAARKAVEDVWPSITESGGGGIAAARKAASDPEQVPFYKNSAFIVAALLIPLVYMVAVAVLFGVGGQTWSDEIKAMVVTAFVAGLLGSITGFFMGSSLGSQKKDAALGVK